MLSHQTSAADKPAQRIWQPDPVLLKQLTPAEMEKFKAFLRQTKGYLEARREYREATEFKAARVIPTGWDDGVKRANGTQTPAEWMSDQLTEWKRIESRDRTPTAFSQLRVSVLKEVLGIPFSSYNHDDDIRMTRLAQYLRVRENYRRISGRPKALIVTTIAKLDKLFERYRCDFEKQAEWISGELNWWRRLSEQERNKPSNRYWIRQLQEHTKIPFPEYNSLDDLFYANATRYKAALARYRSRANNPTVLILTKSIPGEFATDARWIEDTMGWWRGLSEGQRKESSNRWRIGILRKTIGIPFPEYSADDDVFAHNIYKAKLKREEYKKEKYHQDTLLLPSNDLYYRESYQFISYARRWKSTLPADTNGVMKKEAANGQPAYPANWTAQQKWRAGLIDNLLPLPFPEYSADQDFATINCHKFREAREAHREKSGYHTDLLIPIVPGSSTATLAHWVRFRLRHLSKLSPEERQKPAAAWELKLFRETLDIPFPEYNSGDDWFLRHIQSVKKIRNNLAEDKSSEVRYLVLPKDTPVKTVKKLDRALRECFDKNGAPLTTARAIWRLQIAQQVFNLPFHGFHPDDERYAREAQGYIAARSRFWSESSANRQHTAIPLDTPGYEQEARWAQRQRERISSLGSAEMLNPRWVWRAQVLQDDLNIKLLGSGGAHPGGRGSNAVIVEESRRHGKAHYHRPRLQFAL
jgi:hypothetical protein